MATLTKQTVSKQKTSRLDIRLTDAQRQLIERAAELTGSTLTQCTARHLLESARKDIEEATVLHLESQAFEDFIQALDQPAPPAAEKNSWKGIRSGHDPSFPTSAQALLGRENGEVLLWSTVHRQVSAQRAPSSTQHGMAVAYVSFTASGEPAGFYTLSAYSALRARSVSGALGSRALIVEPYDDKARAFYAHFGFQPIPGTTSMYLRLV